MDRFGHASCASRDPKAMFTFQQYEPEVVELDLEPKISNIDFKVLGPYGCPAGEDKDIMCFSSLEDAERERNRLWIPGCTARMTKSIHKAGNTLRIINTLSKVK